MQFHFVQAAWLLAGMISAVLPACRPDMGPNEDAAETPAIYTRADGPLDTGPLTISNPEDRLTEFGGFSGFGISPFQVSSTGDRLAFSHEMEVGRWEYEQGAYVIDLHSSQAIWVQSPIERLENDVEMSSPLFATEVAFSPSGDRLLIRWSTGRTSAPFIIEVFDAQMQREALKQIDFPAMGFRFIDEDTVVHFEAEACGGCVRDITDADLIAFAQRDWGQPDSSLFGALSALSLSTNEVTPLLRGPATASSTETFSEPVWAMGTPALLTAEDGWTLWRLAVPDTCADLDWEKAFPAGLVPDLYRVEFTRDDITQYDPNICSYNIIDIPEETTPIAILEGDVISVYHRGLDFRYYRNGRVFDAPLLMQDQLRAMAFGRPYEAYIGFSSNQIIGYSGQNTDEFEFLICDPSSLNCQFQIVQKTEL